MEHLDILVEDNRWSSIKLEDIVGNAFYQSLIVLGYPQSYYSISVLGCNDKKMRELNRTFRSKDTSTNVLSWPSRDRLALVAGNHPKRPDPVLDSELGRYCFVLRNLFRRSCSS